MLNQATAAASRRDVESQRHRQQIKLDNQYRKFFAEALKWAPETPEMPTHLQDCPPAWNASATATNLAGTGDLYGYRAI